MVPLLKTLTMLGGDDVAFNKEKALEELQEELAKKRLMRPVPNKHMLRLMVLYVEFLGRFSGGIRPIENADRVRAAEKWNQRLEDLLEKSKEVQRLENELRVSRAREEERVRGERERKLKSVKRELEVARAALKDAAGGFRDGRIGSALMVLGAMIYVLTWTLPSELSLALVRVVIFCMVLGGLLYNKMR